MPPAPLYLQTLWRYTNAVIIIIIIYEIIVVMMIIAYICVKSDKRYFAGGMLFVNLLQLVNDRRFDTLQSTQISNLYKHHVIFCQYFK